jgi:hypothetical protein
MANKSESIFKPLHSLTKLILECSTEAKKLSAAAVVDSRGTLNLPRARGDRADNREGPGAGPDDMPPILWRRGPTYI